MPIPVKEDTLRNELHEVVELINSLSLNWVEDKAVRNGDVYPIMQKTNDKSVVYGVEMRDTNQPSTSRIKWEDKGKGKAINLIGMEFIPEVMHVVKRTRISNGEVGPSAKKGKQVQFDLSP